MVRASARGPEATVTTSSLFPINLQDEHIKPRSRLNGLSWEFRPPMICLPQEQGLRPQTPPIRHLNMAPTSTVLLLRTAAHLSVHQSRLSPRAPRTLRPILCVGQALGWMAARNSGVPGKGVDLGGSRILMN